MRFSLLFLFITSQLALRGQEACGENLQEAYDELTCVLDTNIQIGIIELNKFENKYTKCLINASTTKKNWITYYISSAKSRYFLNIREIDSAYQYTSASIRLFPYVGDKEKGFTYNILAIIKELNFENDSAIFYNNKAIAYFTKVNDSISLFLCNNSLASIYNSLGDASKAKYYMLSSRKYIRPKDYKQLASSYILEGGMLYKKGLLDKAITCFYKALNTIKEDSYNDTKAMIYNNLGVMFSENKKYKEAIGYFEKAYFYSKKVYGEEDAFTFKVNIASQYSSLGKKKRSQSSLFNWS